MNAHTPTPVNRLLRLVNLAQEATPATRRQLLEEITAVFIDTAATLSDKQRDIFGLIIAQLARPLPIAERRKLAAALARVPGTPRGLLGDLPPSEDELVDLLRAAKVEEFIEAFARTIDIGPQAARAILTNPSDMRLAEACRSAGFERATYSTIVLLSDPLGLRDQAHNEDLLWLYASVSRSISIPYAA